MLGGGLILYFLRQSYRYGLPLHGPLHGGGNRERRRRARELLCDRTALPQRDWSWRTAQVQVGSMQAAQCMCAPCWRGMGVSAALRAPLLSSAWKHF